MRRLPVLLALCLMFFGPAQSKAYDAAYGIYQSSGPGKAVHAAGQVNDSARAFDQGMAQAHAGMDARIDRNVEGFTGRPVDSDVKGITQGGANILMLGEGAAAFAEGSTAVATQMADDAKLASAAATPAASALDSAPPPAAPTTPPPLPKSAPMNNSAAYIIESDGAGGEATGGSGEYPQQQQAQQQQANAGGGAKPSGSLATNPFRGKSAKEIVDMLLKKGFESRGPDPAAGKGGFVNPANGRSYHIDPANSYGEPPHVDVNRLPSNSPELPKKKYDM